MTHSRLHKGSVAQQGSETSCPYAQIHVFSLVSALAPSLSMSSVKGPRLMFLKAASGCWYLSFQGVQDGLAVRGAKYGQPLISQHTRHCTDPITEATQSAQHIMTKTQPCKRLGNEVTAHCTPRHHLVTFTLLPALSIH